MGLAASVVGAAARCPASAAGAWVEAGGGLRVGADAVVVEPGAVALVELSTWFGAEAAVSDSGSVVVDDSNRSGDVPSVAGAATLSVGEVVACVG